MGQSATGTVYVDARRARFIKRWSPTLIAFGEFIDGYDLTVIGVAMVFLTKTFTLTATDKGLLVAISFVGTALGLVLFGDIADRVGRKKVFAFNLWVFIVTAVGAAFITQVWMLWVMRFLIGVAIGMDLSTSCAFLAEVAPKSSRGRLAGSLPTITLILGAIFSILLAMFLKAVVPVAHHDWVWRGMFLFAALPAFGVLMLRKQLPESPAGSSRRAGTRRPGRYWTPWSSPRRSSRPRRAGPTASTVASSRARPAAACSCARPSSCSTPPPAPSCPSWARSSSSRPACPPGTTS